MKTAVILGSNGMVGSWMTRTFRDRKWNVIEVNRPELDVVKHYESQTLKSTLVELLKDADVAINCIGVINSRTNISDIHVIITNSVFPRILSRVCAELEGVLCIHISTDCVFSGTEMNISFSRSSESEPSATSLYGLTKWLGEPCDAMIVRTSVIGDSSNGRSLIEWAKTQKGKTISGYTNHWWNGVTAYQLALYIEHCLSLNEPWMGVRTIGTITTNKCALLDRISKVYNLNLDVKPVRDEQEIDRTLILDVVIDYLDIEGMYARAQKNT